MTTTELSRAEILAELKELELRKLELQQLLPSTVKSFYLFRCKPETHVWIYAASREQAEERLHTRMNNSYGKGLWTVASKVVEVFADPQDVAAKTSGNFLQSLTRAEAMEFLDDYDQNQNGREPVKVSKDFHRPAFLNDIDNYRCTLRQQGRI